MIAVTLSGCSSRPREFAPQLAAAPESNAALDATTAECSQLLVAGKLDSDGRLGSGAAGAAAGGAIAVAGGAAATSMVPAVGAALASATVVLLPFVALGGAWGMAKMKRAKKEKTIKAALAGCLQERGYVVTGWEKTGRKVSNELSKASSGPAN
ncbi:MAG: hypothetical protein ABIW03_06525 [Sphingomicrobium sp.]